MAILTITKMGNPILRKIADQVSHEEIKSEEFQTLIENMLETMQAVGGLGIAAPQVGVSKQLALIKIPSTSERYSDSEESELIVFINPRVKALTDEQQGFWEGCLSVPGLRGYVERPNKILIEFLDREGKEKSLEVGDLLAIVFQHELDHLQGKIYVDKVAPGKLVFDEEFAKFIAPKLEI